MPLSLAADTIAATEAPRASYRWARPARTRSETRARPGAATSTIRWRRAPRHQLLLLQTEFGRADKLCRKRADAARANAPGVAADRCDLNRPASRSRSNRCLRFEIATRFPPMGLPASAAPARALSDRRRIRSAGRQALWLYRMCGSRARAVRNFPARIASRSRAPPRPRRGA